jgi:hypothetical protein
LGALSQTDRSPSAPRPRRRLPQRRRQPRPPRLWRAVKNKYGKTPIDLAAIRAEMLKLLKK